MRRKLAQMILCFSIGAVAVTGCGAATNAQADRAELSATAEVPTVTETGTEEATVATAEEPMEETLECTASTEPSDAESSVEPTAESQSLTLWGLAGSMSMKIRTHTNGVS